MADDSGEQQRPFKVQDRRRFSDTGEARDVEASDRESASETRTAPEVKAASPPADESTPEISFPTFILSLSTQALAHLGEIPHPVEGTTTVDLSAARQLIDILGLLREKTRGNLDKTEESLLQNILYDLRMRYVERARSR